MKEIKKNYEELVKAIAATAATDETEKIGAKAVLDFVKDHMNYFVDYYNKLVAAKVMLPVLKFKLEGQDYRDAVMDLNKGCQIAHDTAICAVSALNRVAKLYNAPCPVPFSYQDFMSDEDGGHPENNARFCRRVEDFCKEVCDAFFEDGQLGAIE